MRHQRSSSGRCCAAAGAGQANRDVGLTHFPAAPVQAGLRGAVGEAHVVHAERQLRSARHLLVMWPGPCTHRVSEGSLGISRCDQTGRFRGKSVSKSQAVAPLARAATSFQFAFDDSQGVRALPTCVACEESTACSPTTGLSHDARTRRACPRQAALGAFRGAAKRGLLQDQAACGESRATPVAPTASTTRRALARCEGQGRNRARRRDAGGVLWRVPRHPTAVMASAGESRHVGIGRRRSAGWRLLRRGRHRARQRRLRAVGSGLLVARWMADAARTADPLNGHIPTRPALRATGSPSKAGRRKFACVAHAPCASSAQLPARRLALSRLRFEAHRCGFPHLQPSSASTTSHSRQFSNPPLTAVAQPMDRMQPVGSEFVLIVGRHARTTVVAVTPFLGSVRGGQVLR